MSKTTKNVQDRAVTKSKRHEDDAGFRRAADVDRQRAGEARGHDDQGGSRQNEARDYARREGSSENPDTPETHSDARHARERYGEQSAEQRRESARQEQPENLGGQDSRDQSTKDRHSLLGRRGDRGKSSEEEVSRRQEESSGGKPEGYASDTRDQFSRQYAEQQRRDKEGGNAAGGGDYDGNWTKDADKPAQPGPASGGEH